VSRITINGIGLEYELLGRAGDHAVALTPGGRFSMDTPGLRELGEKLVAGGKRVLLWDRPNCGMSDFSLQGETESALHAQTLADLIRELDLGPTALAGGSAGARVSLITASRNRDLVSHLALWWISGGPIGLMSLAGTYCGEAAILANARGMAAAPEAFGWAEQCKRNPALKQALLAQDPQRFIDRMQAWAAAYAPSAASPVPGMSPEDFARLTMPALVFLSGRRDIHHPRATTEAVHQLLPAARAMEPPWPDDEWVRRGAAWRSGEAPGLFVNWPDLAPAILKFLGEG
jgi:pimeloyl-ACP methyl ester carboxylesterase